MVHQCYICQQIFDSSEKLFEHLAIHSDTTRNQELKEKKKELKKKLEKTLKKDKSHTTKISSDED